MQARRDAQSMRPPPPGVELVVRLNNSPIDKGRDVVRIHGLVLETLGVSAWDPVELRGPRRTGALAAVAPNKWGTHEVLLDETLCRNAGVSPGDTIHVTKAAAFPAERVVVRRTDAPADVTPDMLRFGLLGKVVIAGDVMNLVPQDFAVHEDERVRVPTNQHPIGGHDWTNTLCTVVETDPGGLVHITMRTVVVDSATLSSTATSGTPPGALDLTSFPALDDIAARLQERLRLTFDRRDLLTELGAPPRVGILLEGPEGSGKVSLVRSVAASLGLAVSRVWAPELAGLEANAAVVRFRAAAERTRAEPRALLLVEDIDAITPRDGSPLIAPILDELRACLDSGTAVVCTTARPEATARELLHPGLIDLEVEMPRMQRADRTVYLTRQTRALPLAEDVDLDDIARRTPGFVAADLSALCREAAIQAARRITNKEDAEERALTKKDFDMALESVRPTCADEEELNIAQVSFDDVGDMEATKRQLTETVIWPLRHPDALSRLGVEPQRGILLFGPPGCGKTLLIRALANEAEANFFSVKGAELLTKWVGESERAVRELFRRARAAAPSIVFFDEIDALAPQRGASGGDSGVTDRVVAQLLTELDGIEEMKEVVVVAATNRPDLVDPALRRPGRFEVHVEVLPPDREQRGAILERLTRRMPIQGVELADIAAATEGFSGADLASLTREAALAAMRENLEAVSIESGHFEAALGKVRPSLGAGFRGGGAP